MSHYTKPLVYVASPYTKGDQSLNIRSQHEMFDRLMFYFSDVACFFMPLWSHYQHIVFPRTYDQWLEYDFDVIRRCQALIRTPARVEYDTINYLTVNSSGADREVALAKEIGIPVFMDITSLESWLHEQHEAFLQSNQSE